MDERALAAYAAIVASNGVNSGRSYGKTESVKARALLSGVTKESSRYQELLPTRSTTPPRIATTGWFCDRCKEVFAHAGRPDCCMLCGYDGKKKGTKMPKKRLTHKQRRAACHTTTKG